MSSRIEVGPYVLDVMEEIAKERKRLESCITGLRYKDNPQWSWMEDWLEKTDEEHYEDDSDWNSTDKNCNVCGKKDRFFLVMDFSFCNEYGCGIQICGECLEKMAELFKIER